MTACNHISDMESMIFAVCRGGKLPAGAYDSPTQQQVLFVVFWGFVGFFFSPTLCGLIFFFSSFFFFPHSLCWFLT